MDKEVLSKHNDMNGEIYALGKTVSKILEKHEADFLAAYKD